MRLEQVDVYERKQWFSKDYRTSQSCGMAGVFWHRTGGLKVTVSSGNFCPSFPAELEPATHTSEALKERYLNGSQRILGN